MTLKECVKKARKTADKLDIRLAETVLDDGKYYIFSSADETEEAMIGVNKETGEVIDYFPPEHPAYLDAVEAGR